MFDFGQALENWIYFLASCFKVSKLYFLSFFSLKNLIYIFELKNIHFELLPLGKIQSYFWCFFFGLEKIILVYLYASESPIICN